MSSSVKEEVEVEEIEDEEASLGKAVPEWSHGNSYSSFVKLKEKFERATAKSKEFKDTLKEFVEKCHSLEN